MSEMLQLIDTELDVVCGGFFNFDNIVEQSNTATQVGLTLGGHQFHHRPLATPASHRCSVRQTSALSRKLWMPAHSLAVSGGMGVRIQSRILMDTKHTRAMNYGKVDLETVSMSTSVPAERCSSRSRWPGRVLQKRFRCKPQFFSK
jgi:hypothetical protein